MGLKWGQLKQRLQVPKDENSYYENTTWCNRDLIPMPRERRTWGIWGYFGYWTVSGSCISAWSTGSTLLAFGLSPQEAIGVVILGGFLTGLLAVACGWMGETHHIGFTVSSRFSWGMRGSYFPVLLRVFTASIWFGLQAYWGGQATRVLFGAIIPGFAHMKNYFSESSHLLTNDFIGLIIWMGAFIPLVLVPPERLQLPFAISFVLFGSSCIGLLIWAVKNAGGPGSMFHEPGTAENTGWAFMFGITAILGAWGAGTLGQSDWTRYADRKFAPTLSQLVAAPVTISVTAIIGIIVTSAAKDVIGEITWNPIYLFADVQEFYHSSPRSRAGVFFGSLGLVSSQLAISVVLNSVSTGMDMAGLCPKYMNIIRGSYIMAIIGIAIQPWQLVSTANRFLKVLSGFGVFMAPATGLMLADYHVVRRKKLKLNDLYTGNSSSIYWFNKGVNWRAIVAFFSGVWPLLPGLVGTVNSYTESAFVGWIRLYNLTFVVGLAISFFVFWGLNVAFPPPGLGEEAPFVDDDVLYGVGEENSDHGVEKPINTDGDKHLAQATVSS
ncbi:Transporter aclS [Exophiala dermatitidis]|uniref:NCS1 family nucleobase:cation symporter-1 n=1 Tax=Exophiala dermatitidis (strain ATCC 34100 / CBS 525.76 / NIH/UT8656) TaxID=858893 RepID=H6CB72_EXODN|nr:NCS1 family nucleobase:cation symporter-1 [Exophiala dermatitidis NIH/UT8656]EHY61019.1 NCS1 family nucleobase:cation symporter-1 [Exophiala dermatitidis NIH/UT8656]